MQASTGHPCAVTGIWRSQTCHPIEIALSESEIFPPCRDCRRHVIWILIRRTRN